MQVGDPVLRRWGRPAQTRRVEPEAVIPETAWGGRPMVTVVLVEDDPDLRYLTTLMLELEGLRVRAFESGEEALDSCRRDRPDLVLLDWMMPGMSGLDILRALKIRPATV